MMKSSDKMWFSYTAMGKHLPEYSSIPFDSNYQFSSTLLSGKSREPLHAHIRVCRFQIEDQSYIQWIHHDVTKQIRLDELRKDITATLIHDLQGPLGNVLASLELIKSGMSSEANSDIRDMVEVAVRSSQHLKWLVDTILDISRLEAGYPLENFMAIDVGSLIDYVFSIQESEFAQRRVTLQRAISEDAHVVVGEENILRRILINLLNNALKYSRQGQVITVGTRLLPASDEFLIFIEDQGEGIPEEYREIVFEKYQRVNSDSSAMGLGLGLAFCRLAVEAHDGRIWVEEAPSGGACFCFTLPTHGE